MARRRNDSRWRQECLDAYGQWCRVCGDYRVQMDHMHPRSQGGKSVVGNGLPLCRRHHEDKTNGRLRIDPAWLTAEQVRYLEDAKWVWWDEHGEPCGPGWKHFEPMRRGGR